VSLSASGSGQRGGGKSSPEPEADWDRGGGGKINVAVVYSILCLNHKSEQKFENRYGILITKSIFCLFKSLLSDDSKGNCRCIITGSHSPTNSKTHTTNLKKRCCLIFNIASEPYV